MSQGDNMSMSAVEDVNELFVSLGSGPYESGVTHLEHALQAALLAEDAGADKSLVSAALLHDVGHLLLLRGGDAVVAALGRHEDVAVEWLKPRFSEQVVEPVRLHVAAKRYLAAVVPAFVSTLSSDSRTSLVFQGGAFTSSEAAAFKQQPYFDSALRLRSWDDNGKVPGKCTPSLGHFLAYLDVARRPDYHL